MTRCARSTSKSDPDKRRHRSKRYNATAITKRHTVSSLDRASKRSRDRVKSLFLSLFLFFFFSYRRDSSLLSNPTRNPRAMRLSQAATASETRSAAPGALPSRVFRVRSSYSSVVLCVQHYTHTYTHTCTCRLPLFRDRHYFFHRCRSSCRVTCH